MAPTMKCGWIIMCLTSTMMEQKTTCCAWMELLIVEGPGMNFRKRNNWKIKSTYKIGAPCKHSKFAL